MGSGQPLETNRHTTDARPSRSAGFTLLEVLIALVLLSVGMLGIAALSVESLRSGQSALYRTKAINLAADMADSIRANRTALVADANAFIAGVADDGTDNQCSDSMDADGNEVLAPASCTPVEMAAHSVFLWKNALTDTRLGLPEGQGTIARDGVLPVRYTISVLWTDKGDQHRYDLRSQILTPPGGP